MTTVKFIIKCWCIILKLKYKLNDRFGYYINDGKIYTSVRELVSRSNRLNTNIYLLPNDPYTTNDDYNDLGSKASYDSYELNALVRRN